MNDLLEQLLLEKLAEDEYGYMDKEAEEADAISDLVAEVALEKVAAVLEDDGDYDLDSYIDKLSDDVALDLLVKESAYNPEQFIQKAKIGDKIRNIWHSMRNPAKEIKARSKTMKKYIKHLEKKIKAKGYKTRNTKLHRELAMVEKNLENVKRSVGGTAALGYGAVGTGTGLAGYGGYRAMHRRKQY